MTSVYRVNQNFSPVSSFSIQNMTDSGNPTIIEKAGRRYFVGMRTISTTKYFIVYCTDLDGNLIYQKNFNRGSPVGYNFHVTSSHTAILRLTYVAGSTNTAPMIFLLDSNGVVYDEKDVESLLDSSGYKSFYPIHGDEYQGVVPVVPLYNQVNFSNSTNGLLLMRVSDGWHTSNIHYITHGSYTRRINGCPKMESKPGTMIAALNHFHFWSSPGATPEYYQSLVKLTHDATSFNTQCLSWRTDWSTYNYSLRSFCVNADFDITYAYGVQTDTQVVWPDANSHNTYFNVIETVPNNQSILNMSRSMVRVLYRNDRSASFNITRMWEDSTTLNLQILVDGVYRIFSLSKTMLGKMDTEEGYESIQLPYNLVLCLETEMNLFQSSQVHWLRGYAVGKNLSNASLSWSGTQSGVNTVILRDQPGIVSQMNTSASTNVNLFQDVNYQNSGESPLPQITVESFPFNPPS